MRDDETGGEITKLKRLYAAHKDNPNFVLICVCTRSSEAKLKEFVNTHAMPGSHLLLKHEEVPYQFGVVYGFPYYVVLDKAGILRESADTRFELRDLEIELLVAALLEENTNAPEASVSSPESVRHALRFTDFQDQAGENNH